MRYSNRSTHALYAFIWPINLLFFHPLEADIYPGITRTRNFCELCKIYIPAPGTSVSFVRHSYPFPKLVQVLYARATIPGVRVQYSYTYPELCEFHKASIPYPELLRVLLRHSYPYPKLMRVLYARATIPGVRVQHSYTYPELL